MVQGHVLQPKHQRNDVFHFYFTPSLAAERGDGHESAVIMVSYCIAYPHCCPLMVPHECSQEELSELAVPCVIAFQQCRNEEKVSLLV